MGAAKHIGADAVASLSGCGWGESLDTGCSLGPDMQWKCPDARSFQNPMRKGDTCHYNDGCACRKLSAQLRAVTLLKDLVEGWERRLVEEMENAD